MTSLDAIQAAPAARIDPDVPLSFKGPEDAPVRLTTGVTLMTLMQLGRQLELATAAFAKVPDADPKSLNDHLKNIMEYCAAASDKAARLLAGNR
jgi:hypothetical protein